jgi:hypothetical protein
MMIKNCISFNIRFVFAFRQDKLAQLEKERELSDSAFSDEERRKERIISDLSEQLKESEERIQVYKGEGPPRAQSYKTFSR